jgi:NADPH-dependent 2,4-dienoyl-CoA reductase/sulfur reductase-like enzyme
VILGAGFLGLELAGSLSRRGLDVTVVAPEDLPWVPIFGPQVGQWVLAEQQALGVRFRLGTTARKLQGDDQVRFVLLSDNSRLEAEVVIEAVGIEPAVGYLDDSGLCRAGAVPVDRCQKTASPEIYAAGDLADVPGWDGSHRRFEHWSEAEAQGRRAARAMLGLEVATPAPPFFWTEVGSRTLKSVGRCVDGAAPRGVRTALRGRIGEGGFLLAFYGPPGATGGGPRLLGACGVDRDRELIAAAEHLRRNLPLPVEHFEDESFDLTERLRENER